jgi:hypothetical protein
MNIVEMQMTEECGRERTSIPLVEWVVDPPAEMTLRVRRRSRALAELTRCARSVLCSFRSRPVSNWMGPRRVRRNGRLAV